MGTTGRQPAGDAAAALRAWLRGELAVAMKARQMETVDLLRTVIAAIDHAQAVEVAVGASDTPVDAGSARIAGARAGVGAAEAARRELSPSDLRALLLGQVDERRQAAGQYEQHGAHDAALRLRREAEVLQAYIARWDARLHVGS